MRKNHRTKTMGWNSGLDVCNTEPIRICQSTLLAFIVKAYKETSKTGIKSQIEYSYIQNISLQNEYMTCPHNAFSEPVISGTFYLYLNALLLEYLSY